jgi:hypothetical protein
MCRLARLKAVHMGIKVTNVDTGCSPKKCWLGSEHHSSHTLRGMRLTTVTTVPCVALNALVSQPFSTKHCLEITDTDTW